MFGIFPNGQSFYEHGEMVLPASIIIDEFTEPVHLPLSYWKADDYRSSWRSSLEEGIRNKKHSALAVSMYEPGYTNFIFVWVVYFLGNKAAIQNSILFLDECHGFTPEKINDFIEPRTTHNEDGEEISEWSTNIDNVLDFYNSL